MNEFMDAKRRQPPLDAKQVVARRPSGARPTAIGPTNMLALQAAVGNQAVAQLLHRSADDDGRAGQVPVGRMRANRAESVQRVPPGGGAAAPPTPLPAGQSEVVGHIYTIRGKINGEPVVYTGSTAREIAQRLYRDKHTWSTLIKDKTTTIEIHEVKAVLDVKAAGTPTVRGATGEALRAAEQVIIKRRAAEAGGAKAEVNARAAAEESNIEAWGERHQVRIGPRMTFRAGVKVAGLAVFQLLDFFLMYREMVLSQYAMTPYLLEDSNGIFTLNETDRGIFRSNWYWKNYKTGSLAGQRVQISKDEFLGLKEEAELLWGTTDWKGDFVPGLLRQELPVVAGPNDA